MLYFNSLKQLPREEKGEKKVKRTKGGEKGETNYENRALELDSPMLTNSDSDDFHQTHSEI